MSKRADLTTPLPSGYKPCRLCAGPRSYTRVKPASARNGSDLLVLAHWCDRGHRPTGRDAFVRGGPDHLADVQLFADDEEHLSDTWNRLNA